MTRDYLSPPREIKQSKVDHFEWRQLCTNYGPFVIGDSIIDPATDEIVDLTKTGWCGIYPLAAFAMNAAKGQGSRYFTNSLRVEPQPTPQHRLGNKFAEAREDSLSHFRSFLADWRLADILSSSKNVRLPKSQPTDWSHEKKILELHQFQTLSEIDDYVLHWAKNPLLEHNELLYHEIVAARVVDLVCSELLSNGLFHHGGEIPTSFVMAKLCVKDSAKHALALHNSQPYLTENELCLYQYVSEWQRPLLQICIGDTGGGFGNNERLVADFQRTTNRRPDGDWELIEYVFANNYSTKTREERTAFWKRERNDRALPPTIHGLSEVARMVRLVGGVWRIHSNDSGFELNAWSDKLHDSSAVKKTALKALRPVPGCLHYLNFPLKPRTWTAERVQTAPLRKRKRDIPTREASKKRSEALVKEDQLGTVDHRYENAPITEDEFSKFRSRQGAIAQGTLFIGTQNYDHLSAPEHEDTCFELVDWLYKTRDRIRSVIVGASEKTKSYLTKHLSFDTFNFDHRVLLFSSQTLSNSGGALLGMHCAEQHKHFVPLLLDLIVNPNSEPILQNSVISEDQEKITKIAKNNSAWFQVREDIHGEWSIEPTQHLDITGVQLRRLLLGGHDFKGLALHLKSCKAVASFEKDRSLRLGKSVEVFVHLGKLWAQRDFRYSTVLWASNCLRAQIQGHIIEPHSIVFVAMLHPAIDLARELLLVPEFATCEVVGITRRSDARWDFEPLRSTPAKRAVLILDVCESGNLAYSLSQAIQYLDIEVLCTLSLLAIGEGASREDIQPHFIYSECSYSDLSGYATSFPKGESLIVIDADSQFTARVHKKNLARPLLLEPEQKLLHGNHLRFGHWEFGPRHTVFGILLRTLDKGDETIVLKELLEHIKDTAAKELGGMPDLIVVPSDSTAIHIAHQVEDKLLGEKSNALAFASPAFRSHGTFQLELELPETFAVKGQTNELRILFFDDSRSSGATEAKVVKAFDQALKKLVRPEADAASQHTIHWLSYAVLERGVRSPEIPTRTSYPLEFPFEVKRSSFAKIGPQTIHAGECLLCQGSERLMRCLSWGQGLRESVKARIKAASRLITVQPVERIERSDFPDIYLGESIVSELLLFTKMSMVEACLFLRPTPTSLGTIESRVATLFFVGMYFTDVGAYWDNADFDRLIEQVMIDASSREFEIQDAVIAGLAILPVSALRRPLNKIAQSLAASRHLDLLTAIVALWTSSSYTHLASRYESDSERTLDPSIWEEKLARRFRSEIAHLRELVHQASTDPNLNDLLIADWATLEERPHADKPAWIGRTLCGLLHSGKHPGYLSEQVRALKMETVPAVKAGLKNALRLIQKLPGAEIRKHDTRFAELERELLNCGDQDLELIQSLADIVLNEMWAKTLCPAIFTPPAKIADEFKHAVHPLCDLYNKRPRDFVILPCSRAVRAFEALGPIEAMANDHWKHLLKNSIIHGATTPDDPSLPIAVVYIHADVANAFLRIILCTRGGPIDEGKLFLRTHGLANIQVHVQCYGGNLEYQRVEEGLDTPLYKLEAEHVEILLQRNISLGEYRNFFITSLPLMLPTK